MIHRVGPDGQVVIPKELRDAIGLEPGDQVTFRLDGDHVAVRPVRTAARLRGRFASSGMLDELEVDRVAERERGGPR